MGKLSPLERFELFQIYFTAAATAADVSTGNKLTVTALCRDFDLSRQTFYRWKERYLQEGYKGLFDRPAGRKPLPGGTIIPEELVERMVFWRQWLGLSCREIAFCLRSFIIVSHVTVRRILKLRGVVGRVYKRKKKSWKRFEMNENDDLWQIDYSQSDFDGKWRLGVLDDHARMVLWYAPIQDLTADTVVAIILWLCLRFDRRPVKILTDNGPAFTSQRFKQFLRLMDIREVKTAVRHPQTIGKLERFNRTFQENAWLFERREDFVRFYNFERPHSALRGLAPAERYFKDEGFKRTKGVTLFEKTVMQLG